MKLLIAVGLERMMTFVGYVVSAGISAVPVAVRDERANRAAKLQAEHQAAVAAAAGVASGIRLGEVTVSIISGSGLWGSPAHVDGITD